MMPQHTEERGWNGGAGGGGGWVIAALQNEFTEIFVYNFFEGFYWGENEFYLDISANVELCQICHSKRHHESTPDAKIVIGELSCSL